VIFLWGLADVLNAANTWLPGACQYLMPSGGGPFYLGKPRLALIALQVGDPPRAVRGGLHARLVLENNSTECLIRTARPGTSPYILAGLRTDHCFYAY
jgi:hypothetical protein